VETPENHSPVNFPGAGGSGRSWTGDTVKKQESGARGWLEVSQGAAGGWKTETVDRQKETHGDTTAGTQRNKKGGGLGEIP